MVSKALQLLDERVSGTRDWMRRRVTMECAWLDRPLVLKKTRSAYPRPAHRHSIEVEIMVVRLYEHLGRVAYLLDERELHDLAVLRTVNLATLLRRRAAGPRALGSQPSSSRTGYVMQVNAQLARAYAAGCLSLAMMRREKLARRFGVRRAACLERLVANWAVVWRRLCLHAAHHANIPRRILQCPAGSSDLPSDHAMLPSDPTMPPLDPAMLPRIP